MTATIVPMKLNLGCRVTRIPGFKNVDIRPNQDVDILADAADLNMVDSGSCDEIYSSNILEHFPLVDTLKVLKEWNRVLVTGGKLYVSVPDFECLVRLYNQYGMLTDWMLYHGWGEQRHPQQFHFRIFTWATLRDLLAEAGFSTAKRLDVLPYGVVDASTMRDNWMQKPICVNAEAVK